MLVVLTDDAGKPIDHKWNFPHRLSDGIAVFQIHEPCIACGARFVSSAPFVETLPLEQCYEFKEGDTFTLRL
jgi:hypothetical protein